MSDTVSAGDVAVATEGLDAGRVAAILTERARQIGRIAAAETPGAPVIAFTIGAERFALPIAAVAEILPAMPPTPVPGAPAALLGLIVSRGTIFNLFDPAAALGVASEAGAHMLLLRGPAPRIALRIGGALGSTHLRGGEIMATGGLTDTAIAADGGRIGLIAVPRLIEALGLDAGLNAGPDAGPDTAPGGGGSE